jgi:hypothetical protein
VPFMTGRAVVVLNLAGTSANYFDMLGMRPALGRLLRPEDGQRGAPLVIVLSYAAWRRKFGGDPSVVGRSLMWVGYTQVRIIGVAPAGLAYPNGRLVLAQVFGVVGVGVIAGLAGALATSRLLQSLLFHVSPIDLPTLGGVCLLLVAVAALAGYLPARRAARIDPVEALRAE